MATISLFRRPLVPQTRSRSLSRFQGPWCKTDCECGRTNHIKQIPRVTFGASVVHAVHPIVNQVEILKVVSLLHPGVCCERPPETRACLKNFSSFLESQWITMLMIVKFHHFSYPPNCLTYTVSSSLSRMYTWVGIIRRCFNFDYHYLLGTVAELDDIEWYWIRSKFGWRHYDVHCMICWDLQE